MAKGPAYKLVDQARATENRNSFSTHKHCSLCWLRQTQVQTDNKAGRNWEKKKGSCHYLLPFPWLKCCFTSTETVGLLRTGAQDVHLNFHTVPEL